MLSESSSLHRKRGSIGRQAAPGRKFRLASARIVAADAGLPPPHPRFIPSTDGTPPRMSNAENAVATTANRQQSDSFVQGAAHTIGAD